MILFPKTVLKKFPALYSQDGKPADQVKVVCRIFNPYGSGTWFLTEFDPEQELFFGLCHITDAELGYVSKQEMEDLRIRGLGLERDLHWTGTLADAEKECGR